MFHRWSEHLRKSPSFSASLFDMPCFQFKISRCDIFGCMGQLESKIFENVPPWDLETLEATTDLNEDVINVCWRTWANDPTTKKGKIDFKTFIQVLDLDETNEKLLKDAKTIFNLLDRGDDERIEFVDLMHFVFSLDEELDKEQKLRRSYHLYDRNSSGTTNESVAMRKRKHSTISLQERWPKRRCLTR